MSPTLGNATAASDEQLRQLVSYLARTCLEVERGLRPPDHLRGLMPPRARDEWRVDRHLGRFRAGPVTKNDVGPPMLSRLAADAVVATVTTRTEGDRWGAITLRLRADGHHWRLADVQRLLASTHYRQAAVSTTLRAQVPIDEQISELTEERRLVDAALAATTRRLDELSKGDPKRARVRAMQRTWKSISLDLAEEGRRLHAVLEAREKLRVVTRK